MNGMFSADKNALIKQQSISMPSARLYLWLCYLVVMQMTVVFSVHAEENTPSSLAIWPIDSAALGVGNADANLEIIRQVVPDILSSALSTSDKLRLVERQKLLEVLNEQKLGASELAEEATRLRLGRIIGARYMLFGSYLNLGPVWQIDMRMVDVESSMVIATASANQEQGDPVMAADYLAQQLLASFK